MTLSITHSVCHCTDGHVLVIVMLNAVMLNVVMLNVIMLNVFMLNVILLNFIMLIVILLNVVMLNVIMLNVFMYNVVMLNVIMLNVIVSIVVAPIKKISLRRNKNAFFDVVAAIFRRVRSRVRIVDSWNVGVATTRRLHLNERLLAIRVWH
jgi:hypothetical protein